MSMIDQTRTSTFTETFGEPETPFSEQEFHLQLSEESLDESFMPWTEALDPFSESAAESVGVGTGNESSFAEAFAAYRDEQFDESVMNLIDETSEAAGFLEAEESNSSDAQRRGSIHLAPLQSVGEQYIDRLLESLENLDVASLSEAQLAEHFDRFDPESSELSPASQEFLGGLIRKAKAAASFAVNVAKKTATKVIAPAIKAALLKLKKLIAPLLRRVLSFAINRLPAPLQPAAHALARRITGESVAELEGFAEENERGSATIAAVPVDPSQLAEEFDAALAEATVSPESSAEYENEQFDESGEGVETHELQSLAEARSALINRIASAQDGEDLTPAIEQFVPALLMALRVGIRLVGRPRVVKFLAKFLANYIGKWVGPTLARPLSIAIVDTGLRLVTLEAENESGEAGASETEAAPIMLANTIEDTIHSLSELEDFQLEDEDLLQLAMSEAFESAVAANFPASYVKEELQLAPSIQGSFVAQRPRSRSPYRVLNRRPDVLLTQQQASSLHTFGGVTLAAALRAKGISLPLRARVHIVHAPAGASLRTIAAHLRRRHPSLRISAGMFHPLTPHAAGVLLREPRLGVHVPPRFLRSRARIAAGQRFYWLEPLGPSAGVSHPGALGGGPARVSTGQVTAPSVSRGSTSIVRGTGAPSQGWCTIDMIRSEVRVALFVSEADAQRIAADIRGRVAASAILRSLAAVYDGVSRSFDTPDGRIRIIKEMEEGEEFLGGAMSRVTRGVSAALSRVIRSWIMPAISGWLRTSSAEFVRATNNPASGVTLLITLRNVPGLRAVRDVLTGHNVISGMRAIVTGTAFSGSPSIESVVRPGMVRP